MSNLYRRILLWHKLVAMQTGGLALCSAKHRLNRDEAKGWSTTLRNVADEIDQFLLDGTFVLDDKGQRVVHSGQVAAPNEVPTGGNTQRTGPRSRRPYDEAPGTAGGLSPTEGARHDQVTNPPVGSITPKAVSPKKAGGLRIATRKKQ